jgi:hypothetical protein
MFKLFDRIIDMLVSRNSQVEQIADDSDDKVLEFLPAKPDTDDFRATEERVTFLRNLRT